MNLPLPRKLDSAGAASLSVLGQKVFTFTGDAVEYLRQLQTENAALAARVAALESLDLSGAGALRWVGQFANSGTVQNLDVTGLDGDSVKAYEFEFYLCNGAAGTNYEWWPNGSDPTTAGETRGDSDGTMFSVASEMHIYGGNSQRVAGKATLYTTSGTRRRMLMHYSDFEDLANPASITQIVSYAVWTDTAANITSWRLRGSASQILVGSYVNVWARVEE